MKNKIIIAIVVVVLAGLGFYFFQNRGSAPVVEIEHNATSTPETGTKLTNFDLAWNVLQQYLAYAKAHDVAGVEKLSYQLTDSCKKYNESEANKTDCDARMNTVYNFGYSFKKSDFIYEWSDKKQIILSTDWAVSGEADYSARMRSIIFFIVDGSTIKVLSFKPAQGTIVSKFDKKEGEPEVKLSEAEVQRRLVEFTEDKDKDGIEDFVEQCLGSSNTKDCVKTDPTKRDSDRDGWWDGVEALFYK